VNNGDCALDVSVLTQQHSAHGLSERLRELAVLEDGPTLVAHVVAQGPRQTPSSAVPAVRVVKRH
jgi:hypothetical protein